ncbi:MAG: hypothetical protein R2857_13915 [Vampirovibrionales bacterium]
MRWSTIAAGLVVYLETDILDEVGLDGFLPWAVATAGGVGRVMSGMGFS